MNLIWYLFRIYLVVICKWFVTEMECTLNVICESQYDCIDDQRYLLRWNNVSDCSGSYHTNETYDAWYCNATSAAEGRCNCVSSAESECQYFEYKQYVTSSCSGDYEKGAVVVKECFVSDSGSTSYQYDCEKDTFFVSEYSNTECSGSSNWMDQTSFPNECVQYTCKSAGYLVSVNRTMLLFVMGSIVKLLL